MGENHFAAGPTALYGINLLLAALSYYVLQRIIIRSQGANSELATVIGTDWKGKASPLIYVAAILASFVLPAVSFILYCVVALIWLVPDSRIERYYAKTPHG
jgi:uncharacterized membrane protein